MNLIDTILQSGHFVNRPPVLIDIGDSGEINARWKPIARYSLCVAFDADDREFRVTEEVNKTYKKLFVFNRIVNTESSDRAPFYLTRSPFCSSLLRPDTEKLKPWLFKPLFEVEKTSELPSMTLANAFQTADIKYIDWFKVDTQGTDLRIYQSVPSGMQNTILAAEFEPGILDAYQQEDKLYSVMKEMHTQGFWLSAINVKGTQRIQSQYAAQFGDFASERIIRTSPGWAELSYLRNPEGLDRRNLLMLFVFALLERQLGFALELADQGIEEYGDQLFHDCRKEIMRKIKRQKMKLPLILLKRKINKLFIHIDA